MSALAVQERLRRAFPYVAWLLTVSPLPRAKPFPEGLRQRGPGQTLHPRRSFWYILPTDRK